MSHKRVSTDLYACIDKKQFYPFFVGKVPNFHCRSSVEELFDKEGYLYNCITKDLGLYSCCIDTSNPLTSIDPSEADLREKTGVVLFFVSNCRVLFSSLYLLFLGRY